MNAGGMLDVLIVLFLVLQTFLGWRRGLLWQVAGVASVAFGVLLGWACAPLLGGVFHEYVTSQPFRARLLAFLFVQCLVGVSLRVLAAWAEVRSEQGLPRPEREQRRAEDRILGGMFGALKGCVLVLIMVSAAVSCFPESRWWANSRLADPLAKAGSRLLPAGAAKEVARWAGERATDLRNGLDIR
ncbi:MAG: CvpA family protein [Planctomycetota bacterium]|nr:CvpA family protein [Planctomycetota bacterium]